jgi:5S rRNA maturation endonuclease (ribonuclease M5)
VGDKPLTIKGIVIPVDWDEEGKVVAAAISTHDEDEYLIDNDYKGEELLHFVQEEVEVSGVAKQNKDKKIIAVQKYILK